MEFKKIQDQKFELQVRYDRLEDQIKKLQLNHNDQIKELESKQTDQIKELKSKQTDQIKELNSCF